MAAIKGTNVASPVVPFDTADQNPSHEARYGKGGYRTAATVAERDAIPIARREAGMLVFVLSEQKAYRLDDGLTTWVEWSDAALPPGTEGHVLTYVSGEWVAAEPQGGVSDWADLTGKPSSFPPEAHGHDWSDITSGVPETFPPALPSGTNGQVLTYADGQWVAAAPEPSDQSLNTTDLVTFSGVSISGTFPALQIADTVGLYYDESAGYWLLECIDAAHQGVISGFSLANCGEVEFLDNTVQTTAWTGEIDWSDITSGVPSEFTPEAHNHVVADISDFPSLAAVATSGSYNDLADAPSPYTLPTATDTVLGGVKIGSGVAITDGVISVSTDYAAATHSHGISDVTGLQTALDGKQASGSYAATVHAHGISDVTGLQTALDGKASSTHSHAISGVTGLQTALDGKQAAGSYAAATHAHAASEITSGVFDPARIPAYVVRSDTVSAVSYIGRAVSGSATSASAWRIRRTTVAADGTVTFATATNAAWDNRLTATYS